MLLPGEGEADCWVRANHFQFMMLCPSVSKKASLESSPKAGRYDLSLVGQLT